MAGSNPMEVATADMVNGCIDDLWAMIGPVLREMMTTKKV
jgi:hypothetical protein